MPDNSLSANEVKYYHRHLLLNEIGEQGQLKLKQSRVLVIGAGGLGVPAATYLAAAGVGKLGIVDFDSIDISNLHRQVLYTHDQIGKSKVNCAKQRLEEINPNIRIEVFETRLNEDNITSIFSGFDIIVDGTDNFTTRYLINDACIKLHKLNVHGSIFQFDGQLTVYGTSDGPCYRCLYPEPPPQGLVPTCSEGGVLGVLPGIIGTLQATETIKLILGLGTASIGKLLHYDALDMSVTPYDIEKNPACSLCSGVRQHITLLANSEYCQPSASQIVEINCRQLAKRINSQVTQQLIHIREENEVIFGDFENAHVTTLPNLETLISSLDPNIPTILICHMGLVSKVAASTLLRNGFDTTFSLKGGLKAWQFMREQLAKKERSL